MNDQRGNTGLHLIYDRDTGVDLYYISSFNGYRPDALSIRRLTSSGKRSDLDRDESLTQRLLDEPTLRRRLDNQLREADQVDWPLLAVSGLHMDLILRPPGREARPSN